MSVSTAEVLVYRVQNRGAEFAINAANQTTANDRKMLMAEDFGVQQIVDHDEPSPPIAPIDRIARPRIDDRYRIAVDARIALADTLEDYAVNVAGAAVKLIHHADRRMVQSGGIETCFSLFE